METCCRKLLSEGPKDENGPPGFLGTVGVILHMFHCPDQKLLYSGLSQSSYPLIVSTRPPSGDYSRPLLIDRSRPLCGHRCPGKPRFHGPKDNLTGSLSLSVYPIHLVPGPV